MNRIPPSIAVVALLLGFPSMKWVHFMPILETNTAKMEKNMLSSITPLVTWNSTGGAEVGMLVIYTQ